MRKQALPGLAALAALTLLLLFRVESKPPSAGVVINEVLVSNSVDMGKTLAKLSRLETVVAYRL